MPTLTLGVAEGLAVVGARAELRLPWTQPWEKLGDWGTQLQAERQLNSWRPLLEMTGTPPRDVHKVSWGQGWNGRNSQL